MKYKVVFTERAKKQLKKLDKHTAALIIRMAREKCKQL